MRFAVNLPNSKKILKAINLAMFAHAGQVRKVSGEPYFHHPLAVALILLSYKRSKHITDLVVASILHDVPEDTMITIDEIRQEFGDLVANLVEELTNDDDLIAVMGKLEYHKQKLLKMSSYALTIKLCDRLHNMSESPTEKIRVETKELMLHLLQNRKLTKGQTELVAEILKYCR